MPTLADLLLLWFLWLALSPLWDFDFWWHLRVGEQIARTGTIPRVDTWSYTMTGAPWIPASWLFQWLLYQVWSLGGVPLVIASTGALVVLTGLLLLRLALRRRASYGTTFAVWGLGFMSLYGSWSPRPHLFGILFFLLFLWLIDRVVEGREGLWPCFPAVTLVWANIHPSFAMGIYLLGVELVFAVWNRARLRPWLLAIAASAAMTLLTPFGLDLWRYFGHYDPAGYGVSRVGEWASPDFHRNFPILVFTVLVLAVQILGRPCSRGDLTLALVPLTAAFLMSFRNVQFFVPVAVLVALEGMDDAWGACRRRFPWLRAALFERLGRFLEANRSVAGVWVAPAAAILIAALSLHPGLLPEVVAERLDVARTEFPEEAVRFLGDSPPRGRLFANYRWGAYLIWHKRELPVFIDGRANHFTNEIWRAYLEVTTPTRECLPSLDRYEISDVMTFRLSPVAVYLERVGWKVVYQDESVEILRRPVVEAGR